MPGPSSWRRLPRPVVCWTRTSPADGAMPPRRRKPPLDQPRRPENLLGLLLDAYWTSLASDPVSTLLLTALLSLGGVLVVLLGHIVADLVGQLARLLS